jgi:hypothetical protein
MLGPNFNSYGTYRCVRNRSNTQHPPSLTQNIIKRPSVYVNDMLYIIWVKLNLISVILIVTELTDLGNFQGE